MNMKHLNISVIYALFVLVCLLIMVHRNAAIALNMDPSNLSKILTGVTDCSSKLFFRLELFAGLKSL